VFYVRLTDKLARASHELT